MKDSQIAHIAACLLFGNANGNKGITVDINGNEPTNGIMVSVDGFEQKFGIGDAIYDKVDEYIRNVASAVIKNNPNRDLYIGFWVSNDTIYADVSERYTDLHQALKWGIIRNQQAVYDINNSREITLPRIQACGTEYQRRSIADIQARKLITL